MPHFRPGRRLISVVAIALLIGCAPERPVVKKSEPTRDVPVKVVAVQVADVPRTTTQPATVHAYYRSEIRAQSSGYVVELLADIGDVVKKDAVLAVIDVPELRQHREVLKAHIRQLQAQENRYAAGVELAKSSVAAAKAKVDEAKSRGSGVEASLAAAEAEFDRTQNLVQRGSLQNRMLDEARYKRDAEVASREAVEATIESAQADIAVANAKVVAAEAELQSAVSETDVMRKQLDELEVRLAFAEIKAPFDGVVTQRHIEPGDLVSGRPGEGSAVPLFVVSQVDRLRVRIPVPEVNAPMVNPGDTVTLTFPSFDAETPVVGSVTRHAGSLDPSTRTMMVEAEIENADGKLLPGMFGQATIDLATKMAANVLPSRAVRNDDDGNSFVYAVDDQNTVIKMPLTVGADDGSQMEVIGLKPGVRVISSHLSRFVDGQKVAVLP